MNGHRWLIALSILVAAAAAIAFSGSARSASATRRGIARRSYVQTNLVSDIPGLAAHTDVKLKNPWGTSIGPGTPIRVSDNHAGVTTLYDGAGNPQPRAYDPTTGEFRGQLHSSRGGPITIDGLWGLRLAPATPGAGPNTLFFTPGLNHEADGLFGTITPNG
jgi:hypothetical protein